MTAYAAPGEIAAALRGARRIAFPPALGEPDLVACLPELLDSPVELLVPFRTRALALASLGPNVRVRAAFGGRRVRRESYAPVQLSRLPELTRPGGPLEVDVALVRLAPADERGMHNVGPSASLTGDLVEAARIVIAEIDPDLPHTYGDTAVPASAVTLRVEATRGLELPPEGDGCVPTEREHRLAGNVAELVPDHAPVQIGMGHATRAIPAALASHTGLRLIAGLATPDLCTIVEHGALDDRWSVPVGEAVGPRSFMQYIDRNSRLSLRSTRRLHDVRSLSELSGLVTVNTALAVDLLGRAACESHGGEVRGGLGGLVEFLMAGRVAAGGINVLALPSTAGGRSRIVDRLGSEDVSIPASFVDFLVTEWGIADLRATTREERVERIAAVADPDHRHALVSTDLDQHLEEQ